MRSTQAASSSGLEAKCLEQGALRDLGATGDGGGRGARDTEVDEAGGGGVYQAATVTWWRACLGCDMT